MNVIKTGIKILNSSNDNVFIAVQTASKQSGYSDQYLRKMLQYEKIQGIKIYLVTVANSLVFSNLEQPDCFREGSV